MAMGGLIGGYVGGMISHRANRTVIRAIVRNWLCGVHLLLLEMVWQVDDARWRLRRYRETYPPELQY